MPYQILRRHEYEIESAALPLAVRRKAEWATVQLGVRGRTPSTKGTVGLPLPWRRSPVQGSHYYLWWLNAADSGLVLNGRRAPQAEGAILVHSVRHHDDTATSPVVGTVNDYEPLDVGLLDPRFDDQEEVALVAQEGELTFTVIEGMPGSGKTVALLFLARDLATRTGTRKVRYITYTERLKRAARELFDALGPEMAQHITVHTINDVVKQLLGVEVLSSPYSEIATFLSDLDHVNPALLGAWRDYPLTLYTELRAQVAGRTFPASYQLPAHREEQMRRRGNAFDVERYGRRRKLDAKAAELAVSLANRFSNRYFLDQQRAAQALEKVSSKGVESWLAHTDAFIIDEVQDFTLLQIALIAEMAAARRSAQPERPLALTVAGDESQIVQPTGFKWGVTKDLIHNRLGVHPRDYHFETQRRSPPVLAQLTQNTWQLYGLLPKDLRPSAIQPPDDSPTDVAERGLVVLTPPPVSCDDPAWHALLDELVARPGRALIDLTEQLGSVAGTGESRALEEVIFQAREIKGLERGTVLIHGLQHVWQQVQTLTDDNEGDRLAQMEARRLIDQMRVALSRSTSRLILFEEANATVFVELAFEPAVSAVNLALGDLVEMLQGESMTDAEMVLALMDEADDLADRGRLEEALRRNRRAAALTQHAAAADLLHGLRLQEADLLMHRAEHELAAGQITQAQETHKQVETLLEQAGAESLHGERAERWQTLSQALFDAAHSELAVLLDQAQRALDAGRLSEAIEAATSAFHLAVPDERAQVAAPAADSTSSDQSIRAIQLSIRAHLARADALATGEESGRAALLSSLEWVSARYQQVGDSASFVFGLLRDLYSMPADLKPVKLNDQIQMIGTALDFVEAEAAPGSERRPVEPAAREFALAHLARLLDGVFGALGNHVALYRDWATTATQLARLGGFPAIDDRLWDLEERYRAAGSPPGPFAAFLAAHNGDPASAAVIWEQLGDLIMAIESAREAGDFERAARLYRSAHRTMPEEFATALKAQRQVQQLQQKYRALYPAERRTLAEELARLHAELTREE